MLYSYGAAPQAFCKFVQTKRAVKGSDGRSVLFFYKAAVCLSVLKLTREYFDD
jgi:hypothetical protein